MAVPIAVPVADGDIFELRLIGTLHGQMVMNTFHYKNVTVTPTNLTGVNFDQLAAAFETAFVTPLLNLLSEELTDVVTQVQKIEPARYLAYTYNNDPGVGQVTGSAVPSGVSVVMRRRAQEAGRYAQGRIYVPGLPVAYEDDSELAAAQVTPFTNVAAGMLTDLVIPDTITLSPVLYNKQIGTALYDVQVTEVDTALRYQRRREVGRGA